MNVISEGGEMSETKELDLIEKLVRERFKDVERALLKEKIRRGDMETQRDADLERSMRGYY